VLESVGGDEKKQDDKGTKDGSGRNTKSRGNDGSGRNDGGIEGGRMTFGKDEKELNESKDQANLMDKDKKERRKRGERRSNMRSSEEEEDDA